MKKTVNVVAALGFMPRRMAQHFASRSMFRAAVVTGLFVGTGLAQSAPVPVNPTGGTVSAGSATISGEGSSYVTINQTSNTAIINWSTFSIGSGNTTQFIQPSAASAVLNRVAATGGLSLIDGTLTANGQVYLVNGNGIVVGAGAGGERGRADGEHARYH